MGLAAHDPLTSAEAVGPTVGPAWPAVRPAKTLDSIPGGGLVDRKRPRTAHLKTGLARRSLGPQPRRHGRACIRRAQAGEAKSMQWKSRVPAERLMDAVDAVFSALAERGMDAFGRPPSRLMGGPEQPEVFGAFTLEEILEAERFLMRCGLLGGPRPEVGSN